MRVKGFIAVLASASCLFAQEAPLFPKPAYFRHHLYTPSTRVEMQGPVRLRDFVVNGTLELSLRNYLELVLANNTEVAIQRLSIEQPKNNIMRAFGVFDPTLEGRFNANRSKSLPTRVLDGATLLNQLNQTASFTYNQTLQTGTQFTVGFDGNKNSSNDTFTTWNPALTSTLRLGFTQPLLRNRGSAITRLPIMVARSSLRRAEYDLRNEIIRSVSTAENVYWDVIEARENLKVQEQSLALADAFLKRSQRELELGALSPLDIYRPQQNYAQAEIQVSQARYLLAQREDALRRQIGADLDPEVRKMPISLSETVAPLDSGPVQQEEAVQRAMSMRPDLKSQQQALDVDELNIKSATNSLRPDLSLTGGYQSRGRGGMYYEREDVFGGGSQIKGVIPGGFGDALDQMFGFNVPTYQFGLTLRLPLRDRAATATLANAMVSKKMDTLRVRSLEQQIRLQVLNAINQVESSKASVKLATIARDFAQKQLDAEQKKYDLGTSIAYFVQEAQAQLTNAESVLVRNTIQYRRNLLNLMQMTGDLLDQRGIVLQ